MSLVSGQGYYISNLGVAKSDWTAYVNITPPIALELGSNSPQSKWIFTQPEGQGGKWTIRDTISSLYIGYSSPATNNAIVQAVNASEEIYWDIWHTNPEKDGHYQLFVPNTNLSATLIPASEVADHVYLTYAISAYENTYQNWVMTNTQL